MFSRPSIDVLFETAAEAYGPDLIAVVLTGANSDGASGLQAVVEAGGTALIQNPVGAFASAMPRAALEACPGSRVMSLSSISRFLRECRS